MAKRYTIRIPNGKSKQFETKDKLLNHINTEVEAWKKIFDIIKLDDIFLRNLHTFFTSKQMGASIDIKILDILKSKINDIDLFNGITHGGVRNFIPPFSDTEEYIIISALAEANKYHEVKSVFIHLIEKQLDVKINMQGFHKLGEKGEILLLAGSVNQSLPANKNTKYRISRLKALSEEQIKDFNEKNEELGIIIENAKLNNEGLKERFDEILKSNERRVENHFLRIKKILFYREKRREKAFHETINLIQEETREKIKTLDTNIKVTRRHARMVNKKREDKFNEILNLFHTQLRFRAPVKLWRERAQKHRRNSRMAFGVFFIFSLLIMCVSIAIPFYFGDYIAESFHKTVCNTSDNSCKTELYAKGPLTLSGIFLLISVSIWFTKLNYKVYLSERHLALDADEKGAFSETYLAMKEGKDVSPESEAIVLASLFRPTQDGIIKDDDSKIDVSLATILAKNLSKP